MVLPCSVTVNKRSRKGLAALRFANAASKKIEPQTRSRSSEQPAIHIPFVAWRPFPVEGVLQTLPDGTYRESCIGRPALQDLGIAEGKASKAAVVEPACACNEIMSCNPLGSQLQGSQLQGPFQTRARVFNML